MRDIYITAIKAAVEAGREIMKIYDKENFQVETKSDNSPLTIADKRANDIINQFLLPTGIPIISEENNQLDFSERRLWNNCWIVDPLDGTKEFIKKNGEFTVNIAFITNNRSIFGVIYVPAQNELYFGDVEKGKSYKGFIGEVKDFVFDGSKFKEIYPSIPGTNIKVVGSRSHMNQFTIDYIEQIKIEYNKEIEIVSKGSSLKFCLVAEGEADVYPRFAPTMEWDTAAGQAICNAVGLKIIDQSTSAEMLYNRKDLLNNFFLISNLG